RIHQGRYDVSMPALTKDHKRNEDQYAVSIKEDTTYPCLHSPKTTKGMKINRAVSKEDQYAVLDIWHVNILEDIKRGPYSKKPQYAVSNALDTPTKSRFSEEKKSKKGLATHSNP
ncbi:hypothetical protein Tco_0433764, partial [Tanacetum coccineum]